ncbi:MAG: hypothetical protein L0229_12270 [Blastocatellia bacterium]|nr:hypothetical protein [Blastocatellia bacterium]
MSTNSGRNDERGMMNDEPGTPVNHSIVHHSSFLGAASGRAVEKQAPPTSDGITNIPRARREFGDQVNKFLLCTLVTESAKRIKANAEKVGESLPMTMIVRGVLRSYRTEAKERPGLFVGSELDIVSLKVLNNKVLRDEIARHSKDRVKNSEARLARAKRLGDDTKIKAERDDLEQAITLRDRLAERFR